MVLIIAGGLHLDKKRLRGTELFKYTAENNSPLFLFSLPPSLPPSCHSDNNQIRALLTLSPLFCLRLALLLDLLPSESDIVRAAEMLCRFCDTCR